MSGTKTHEGHSHFKSPYFDRRLWIFRSLNVKPKHENMQTVHHAICQGRWSTINHSVASHTQNMVHANAFLTRNVNKSLPLLLLFLLLLRRWHYSPMQTFATLMDFSQSAPLFDLSFQFFILNLLILFAHSSINIWLYTFLLISVCTQFY